MDGIRAPGNFSNRSHQSVQHDRIASPPLALLFGTFFDDLQPKIVAVVHCVRLLLAEFDSPFACYDLFGDYVAALASFPQEERVISRHSRAQTPPANSAVGH